MCYVVTPGRSEVKAWLKDTGATWSSTNDKSWFKRFEPTDKYRIQFGDGEVEIAAGVGDVDIVTYNQHGRQVVIELKEVLYLPNSFGNIFSSQHYIGPAHQRTGNEYYGGPAGTMIRPYGRHWITLLEKGTSAFLVPDGPQYIGQLWSAQKADKNHIAYWHDVMGHPNKQTLVKMAAQGKVQGMPTQLTGVDEFFCTICATCKSRRKSVKSNSRTPAQRPFQVVSSDLMEVNVRSKMGRYKYAVVYVCHKTRAKYVYGIAKKSETWRTFTAFVQEVVAPSGHAIETLMTDGGGEYSAPEFAIAVSDARHTQGSPIREHRRSAPYTQAQNGIAERAVGLLGNTARCLLKQANKPASWWFWALDTAAYLNRLTLTKGNGFEETPLELITGISPDTSHLKPWGSVMYMHVYDHNRHRFDDNARATYLVMYPERFSRNTYTGFDPVANRTYDSLHVNFDPRPDAPPTVGHDIEGVEEFLWRWEEEDEFDYDMMELRDMESPGPAAATAHGDAHIHTPQQRQDEMPAVTDTDHGTDESSHSGSNSDDDDPQRSPVDDSDDDDPQRSPVVHMDESRDDEEHNSNVRHNTRLRVREREEQVKERERVTQRVAALSALGGVTAPRDNSPGGRPVLTEGDIRHGIDEERRLRLGEISEAEALRLRFNPDGNAMHHGISNMQAMHIVRGWNRTQRRQFVSSAVAGCCRSCKDVFREDLKLSMMQGIQNRSDLSGDAIQHQQGLCCAAFNTLNISVPQSRREMLKSPQVRFWLEAEKVEMDSMDLMEVYEPVRRSEVPTGANICKSRFVYDIKQDEQGRLQRYKVRWVAKGFSQRKGRDYWDTFSPVVRMSSVRTLIALATANGWRKMEQLDIKTCFLESKLEEGTEIYIEPPEQFEAPDTVYRLRKSLYGLKQSSRLWWLHLGSVLENKGNMRQLEYENCIWQRRNPRTGKTVYLGAYVDDLVVTGDDEQGIEEITKLLESEFRVTRLGELKWILGCHLERDLQTGTSVFNQTKYIMDLVQKHKVAHLPCPPTPLVGGDKILKSWCPEEQSDEFREMNKVEGEDGISMTSAYRSIVGGLLWAARCTRPDIMFATGQLCKYLKCPGKEHLNRARHVLCYLHGTKNIGVRYGSRTHACMQMGLNELVEYTDASFDDQEGSLSTYGNITYLNYGPIAWNCKTQTNLAQSSCESEYIGLSHAGNEAAFHSELLTEMGYGQGTVSVCIDNTAAVELAKSQSTHQRSKHIRRRYHHIKSLVKDRSIGLVWMNGKFLPADALTKALPLAAFQFHRHNICSE